MEWREFLEVLSWVGGLAVALMAFQDRYARNIQAKSKDEGKRAKDPFLRYYVFGTLLFLLLLWALLEYTPAATRVGSVRSFYVLTAAVAAMFALWRFVQANAYEQNPGAKLPVGFEHEPRMMPYWVLLAGLLVSTVGFILSHVTDPAQVNALLQYTAGLTVALFLCRVGWLVADTRIERARSERERRGSGTPTAGPAAGPAIAVESSPVDPEERHDGAREEPQ